MQSRKVESRMKNKIELRDDKVRVDEKIFGERLNTLHTHAYKKVKY